MPKLKKRLKRLSDYNFCIEGSFPQIKKIVSILEQAPLEKITLSISDNIFNWVEEHGNLDALIVRYGGGNTVYMTPRYQVLDDVIVDKSLNAEVRELGKHERLGKRIEFPEYWIVIYYDSLWKDKFRKL